MDQTSGTAPVPGEPAPAAVAGSSPWRPRARTWLGLALALVVGLGLRGAYAAHLSAGAAEWEADGFVLTWEGRPWGAWNRVRPPGLPLLLGRLGEVVQPPTVFAVRLLCVGLSLVALLAALDLALSLSRLTTLTRRSALLAALWMAWIWALAPTLVASSVSPTPELLVGGAACLTLAGLARRAVRPGPVAWLSFALGATALVLLGGLAAACALVVGVVVSLLAVPRLGVSLPLVLGLALALGVGWLVQRGPRPERPWLPDTAGAHSLVALTEPPLLGLDEIPVEMDRRERQVLEQAGVGVGGLPLGELGHRLARRAAFDQMGATRFDRLLQSGAEALPPLPWGTPEQKAPTDPVWLTVAVGLWDVFLRGGLLLFAIAVIGTLRPVGQGSWPRGGAVVGAVVWLVLLVAGAVGPFALAPFDLLLLGVAGAGVAGTDPARRWTRRVAFLVGGGLLCSLLATGGWRARPLSAFTTETGHGVREGQVAVAGLQAPGPVSAQDHDRVAMALMQVDAPTLRQPEPALRHAMAATRLAPEDEQAASVLVKAYVENLLVEEAAELAESIYVASGRDSIPARVQLEWVQEVQRRLRAASPR